MERTGVEVSDNGSGELEDESPEQLGAISKTLDSLRRGDGSVVSLTKAELGLLHTILRTTSEAYREEAMWRMMDFMDDEEALDHVSAYYESKELGMDTSPDVALAFALCSANRKGNKTNLIAVLSDTLQHGKWATASTKGKKNVYPNQRSPLSDGN